MSTLSDTILAMSFFWQAVCFEGGLAVLAILADLLFLLGLDYPSHCWCDSTTAVQIIGGLPPLLAVYYLLKVLPLPALKRVDTLVRQMFREYMQHWNLGQLALVAALTGVGEELLFRGLFQLGLSGLLGVGWAILITSVIFGLAHAVTPTYCMLTFFISLYFSWLFVLTGNLIVPIAIHALYDFFVFLVLKYAAPRRKKIDMV